MRRGAPLEVFYARQRAEPILHTSVRDEESLARGNLHPTHRIDTFRQVAGRDGLVRLMMWLCSQFLTLRVLPHKLHDDEDETCEQQQLQQYVHGDLVYSQCSCTAGA